MRASTFVTASALGVFLFSATSHAEQPDANAQFFTQLYIGTCMKNVANLEALRAQLVSRKLPGLTAEQARPFLNGKNGDAWPVPYQGKMGNVVLALPAGLCGLYMRRGSQAEVERQFIKLVAKAPAPLIAEKKSDQWNETAANGRTHTISYAWSVPGAARKMTFMLTTASSDSAQLQVLATAAMTTQ